jgi:hypothetical protein
LLLLLQGAADAKEDLLIVLDTSHGKVRSSAAQAQAKAPLAGIGWRPWGTSLL